MFDGWLLKKNVCVCIAYSHVVVLLHSKGATIQWIFKCNNNNNTKKKYLLFFLKYNNKKCDHKEQLSDFLKHRIYQKSVLKLSYSFYRQKENGLLKKNK